jgi:hypothetical protein
MFSIEMHECRCENARHTTERPKFLLRIFAFLLKPLPNQCGFGSRVTSWNSHNGVHLATNLKRRP